MAVFREMGTSFEVFNSLDIKTTLARIAYVSDNWDWQNVTSPFSRIYYIKDGGGSIFINGEELELKPNHIYIIPAGTTHSSHLKGYLDKIFVHFNIIEPSGYDFLRSIRKMLSMPCSPMYIEKMYRLFESPSISDTLMLKSCILSDIMKMVTAEPNVDMSTKNYSEKIMKAMKIISSAPSIQLNVKDIAAELFVSESYLMKKFKEELGMPISKYIDQMVIYNAQIALIETDEPISAISERFGFTDKFYFSKRFKQLCGQTPIQYRKKHNML